MLLLFASSAHAGGADRTMRPTPLPRTERPTPLPRTTKPPRTPKPNTQRPTRTMRPTRDGSKKNRTKRPTRDRTPRPARTMRPTRTKRPTRRPKPTMAEDDCYDIEGNPAIIRGDPHFTTFAGVNHDFQGLPDEGLDQFYYIYPCSGYDHK